MGSYAENNLDKDEFIIIEERVSWGILIWNVIWAVLLILASIVVAGKVASLSFIKTVEIMDKTILSQTIVAKIVKYVFWFFIIIKLFDVVRGMLRMFDSELTVTNKKVIVKTGLLKQKIMETPISGINNVVVKQDLFGMLLDFGDITLHTGSGAFNVNGFTEPLEIKSVIFEQIERLQGDVIDKQAEAMVRASDYSTPHVEAGNWNAPAPKLNPNVKRTQGHIESGYYPNR